MHKIRFVKNNTIFEVESGSNLMASLIKFGVPVASSCKGDGVCCKCTLKIVEGEEHLSPKNSREMELGERNQLNSQVRVSCQSQVFGDITVDADYW